MPFSRKELDREQVVIEEIYFGRAKSHGGVEWRNQLVCWTAWGAADHASYGSRLGRFLQVRISVDLLRKGNDKSGFVHGQFILCGRVFVPFYSKDFINWHSPKKLRKTISRFIFYLLSRDPVPTRCNVRRPANIPHVLYSNPVPAIEFATEDIYFIDDIGEIFSSPSYRPRICPRERESRRLWRCDRKSQGFGNYCQIIQLVRQPSSLF